MDSNITIHIVEPGSSTPIEPVVPNTGLFTHGIGGPEATILGITAAVIILAVALVVLYYRNKKQGKFISLKHKKATTIGLASLAAVVSLGTVAGLLKLGASAVDDSLTVTSSSEELTIELADEPVFAVLPVELTVKEATQAGYTLTAFTDSTDLVSTKDSSKVIPMVAVDEGELAALTNNTYGLALDEKPTTKDAEVYMPLSTDSSTPTILKATDFIETEANDTTTIYYGFYITPDVPYGTYTGSDIYYNVEKNYITNLSFNGNGNDGGETIEGMTIMAGDTITLPENTYTKEGYNFIGWNTVAEPTEQDPGETYADQADYTAELGETKDVTLHAQWKALPVIGDLTYMQDFAVLSDTEKNSVLRSMAQEVTYMLKDKRDEQEYTVAKLRDNNVWMTKNLDLAGGTKLYSETSDVPEGHSGLGDNPYYTLPISSASGFSSGTTDYVYNVPYDQADRTVCADNHPCHSYYSWLAATAWSGRDITSDDTDAPYSICPKGWRLPNSRTSVAGASDFYRLAVAYGMNPRGTSDSTSAFYDQAGPGTIPNFSLAGRYGFDSFVYGGRDGIYWSSTGKLGSGRGLYFSTSYVYSADGNTSAYGYAVRCVVR